MNKEKIAKKIESCGIEPVAQEDVETSKEERELSEEEIGEQVGYMKAYKRGLLNRIEEIKSEIMMAEDEDEDKKEEVIREGRNELENLQEVVKGLPEFIDDIEQGDYEAITIAEKS